MENLLFNPKPSTILHIDLNSCFATIEQQANFHLRGKPIAVAAYISPNGCILAPSIEAKRYGIRTGMRVKDGKLLYPNLIVLSPDPWKYRNIHLALRRLISDYTADFNPKSIDEFVLNLEDYPSFDRGLWEVAKNIKKRIREEIGDWLTVSIGIAPNRFLAKLASGMEKPDGLTEINKENFGKVYSKLKLTGLPYIKTRNAARLNDMGIFSVTDFYSAPLWKLRAAFESINGYYWYVRLRGWEIDDVAFGRRSYGNSYALPKPLVNCEELSPILSKLVMKMSTRLRHAGYKAKGVHLAIAYRDGDFWHKGVSLGNEIFDTRDIYRCAFRILCSAPLRKQVRELAVSCFNLRDSDFTQLELFEDIERKTKITSAVDKLNERWGDFVITPARMLGTKENVPDRIAFGGVKEIEEFTLGES